ncbi:MAG: DUF1292 domain-containing protein [Bacilli bacterium]|nr:DUF1292 domain-containing protein [Bacilli bacterium]
MDRKVSITNSKGQKVVADVVTIFRIKELDSDYIVYTFNQKDAENNVKDYVSKLRLENGEYYFDTIIDENEWNRVKKAINMLCEDGE